MRTHSWLPLGVLALAVSFSTYACGGDDPLEPGDDGGTSSGENPSGSSSGQASSSGASGGQASSSGGSSSGEASSSGGSSSGEPEDAGSDPEDGGGSSGEPADAGADPDDGGDDAGPVDPPAAAVQYLGRWNHSVAGSASASWPGAKVVVHFRGPALSVTIEQTGATIGNSRFDVLVDGTLQPGVNNNEVAALVTQNGAQNYPVVSGLANTEHVVEIVRRTEPQQGVTTFRDFTFPGGGTLLAPPARPQRRIEILTESTSNGYGVDSPLKLPMATGGNFDGSRVCPDVSIFNNGRRSFGAKLAERFDAELSLLGMSAIGFRSNASGNQAFGFGVFYPRINPLAGDAASNLWSFAQAPADVVMILLGGADFQSANNTFLAGSALVPSINNLVGQVRTGNPDAYIFLVVGPQIKNSYPAGLNQRTELQSALESVRASRNDAKLLVRSMNENNNQALEVGCAYHASEALHTLMAEQAEQWLSTTAGWN